MNSVDTSKVSVVITPRKMRWYAWVIAIAFMSIHTIVGILLRISETGVYFRVSDQIAMVLLGGIFAGLSLLFLRPRVRVMEEGIGVRNLFAERIVPWDLVVGVSFPESSSWARIDIPDDEYVTMLAIAAMDGHHAVSNIRELRAAIKDHLVTEK